MNRSSNLPIFIASAIIVTLLLAMAAYVIHSSGRIEEQARAVQEDSVPGLIDGHTIRSTYSQGFVCALQLNETIAPKNRTALKTRLRQLDQTAQDACDSYAGTMIVDPRVDSANYQAVITARNAFLSERAAFLALAEAGRRDDATRLLQERLSPAYDSLMAACDTLVAYNNRTGTALSSDVVATLDRSNWIVAALALLAVVTAGFMVANHLRQLRIIRELRESEMRFSTAFELSPRAMTISRKRDGVILDANSAFLANYGMRKEQVIGKSTVELGVWKTKEDRDRFIEQLDREGRVRDFLRTLPRVDAPPQTTLLSVSILNLGGVECMLSIAQDITELLKAEQALARTVAEFRAIFDSTRTSIGLVDENGRMVRWNRALENFLGYNSEELGKMRTVDFTHPDDRARGWERFGNQVKGFEDSYQIEKRYLRKDGRTVWGRLTTSVVRAEDGSFLYGVGMIDDVTEHKRSDSALRESEDARVRLQQQLFVAQKLEALGLLAGGVAHDFNNMIAATLLHIDLIRGDPGISPECAADLLELKSTVKRAGGLTRQLLLFSRREPAHREHLDLNILVANLRGMLGRLVGSHIALVLEESPDPLWIHADAGMIDQVLMNLVVNARDAMPRGGEIALRLDAVDIDARSAALHPSRREGRYARLFVRDSGVGMSPEVLGRIFEPFFTTKDAGKGTGLGLSTALGIVQQHQGWFEVESTEGKGTTFTICLPAHSAGDARPSHELSSRSGARPGGATVLLAEDNEQLRTITARILRQHGYVVLEASNGIEAQGLLDTHPARIDLLLTDVVMPGGIFGHDLAAGLRDKGRDTRAIVMSAHNTMIDRDAIEQAGGVYLAKPFDTATLLEVVRSTLDEALPGTG